MHSRLPRGVRPRLEGKQRTALSSRAPTRISWSPLSRLKGVQPTLQFRERTWDCSPGQAGKEGPQLARTRASQGFPRAAVPWGFLPRHDEDLREPLVRRQGSQVCMREARGSASLLSSPERGQGPQDTLQQDYRSLSRVAAENPHFPRLLPGTLGNFPGCL